MSGKRRKLTRDLGSMLLVAASSYAFASGEARVSVTVNADESCIVKGRTTACASVPTLLLGELAVKKDTTISVSPSGCGERAVARGQAFADTLRKAGFTKVLVVGFLSEPNSQCIA